MRGSVVRNTGKAAKSRTPLLAAEARRKRIATAIADDIMEGGFGKADRLVLEVAGRDGGGWGREPLIDRIMLVLAALEDNSTEVDHHRVYFWGNRNVDKR